MGFRKIWRGPSQERGLQGKGFIAIVSSNAHSSRRIYRKGDVEIVSVDLWGSLMDSRMKEICISNCPAVVRRCSDDKNVAPKLCKKEEPGSWIDRAACSPAWLSGSVRATSLPTT
jgi:hypothetical protein